MKLFLWLLRKSYLWIRSIMVLRSRRNVLLVGYPKTGSTWLRYFLYLCLSQRKDGLEDSIDAMNQAMPEFGHSSMFNEWGFEGVQPLVKTHQSYYPFYSNCSAILVVRDPRDIVVSYYHYSRGVKNIDYEGSFSDLLRHKTMGAESFMKHYDSWKAKSGLIIKYEDLKDNPQLFFSKIANFCGIERNSIEIDKAIEGASFSHMKKIQEKSKGLQSEFKDGHEFVRSGKKSQWKDLFSEADIAYYESLKVKYDFHLYD